MLTHTAIKKMAKKLSTKIEVLGCMTSNTQFTADEIVIYRGSKKVLTLDRHNRETFDKLLKYVYEDNTVCIIYVLEDYLGIKCDGLEVDIKTYSGYHVGRIKNCEFELRFTDAEGEFTLSSTKYEDDMEIVVFSCPETSIAEYQNIGEALTEITKRHTIKTMNLKSTILEFYQEIIK